MYNIMIAGAGKIGALIACILADSGDYQITLVDKRLDGADVSRLRERFPKINYQVVDVEDPAAMGEIIQSKNIEAIVSSLPYFCNNAVADLAKKYNLHYFDLTEDVSVTNYVAKLAKGASTAFVPQCGLAPGFINIAAHSLMQHFEELDSVSLRVGALPQFPSNSLQYALTWSTDGLINEYGNPCHAIEHGKPITTPALEGLEALQIDGLSYEAFNTSGGLGSLGQSYVGRVRNLNYKTLRYPGHCKKMQLLMNDLRLNEDRATLKMILERAIPKTYQDVVVIFVAVMGYRHKQLMEENYVKKVYPAEIAGMPWSAIQVTTASGICVVIDLVLSRKNQYKGLVLQEQFTLEDVISNRFGQCYK